MEKGREYTVPMVKAQAMEGQARLTAMKLEKVDVRRRLTPAKTIASSREDNGAGKTLPPRSKRVPNRNADMMKKPAEHLPPLKEEVRKIRSRKDGTSMKRLLEGIDRVRELMVTRQNSTPIRMQCDAVVASSGGGVCHDPPDTPADRDPSRQPAAGARGRLPK